MRRIIGGVEVVINPQTGAIGWMSDWTKVWALVDAGLLRAVHFPQLWGHVEFFPVDV